MGGNGCVKRPQRCRADSLFEVYGAGDEDETPLCICSKSTSLRHCNHACVFSFFAVGPAAAVVIPAFHDCLFFLFITYIIGHTVVNGGPRLNIVCNALISLTLPIETPCTYPMHRSFNGKKTNILSSIVGNT